MAAKISNPILTGFNPDPSMIYADGFYYIATSTFEYYPGVQIHKSADLVNWEVVSRPINKDKLNMTGVPKSGGVWAPCLSYDGKMFYLVYSNVTIWCDGPFKDCANYIISAKEVDGKWSEPVYINSSGFDASLFHDDDGKKYYLNMEWDYRKTGSAQFSGILIQEYDAKAKKLVGKQHKIFGGTDRGLVEGAHIYKKDGYYYLFTAEGGTNIEHAETVCRSRDIFGPYELHPNKHIITSYKTQNPLQKAGHASICKDNDGQWYMAHLCGRKEVKDKCVLGRETSIQNIDWVDGWPYVRGGGSQPRGFFEISKDAVKLSKKEQIEFTRKNLETEFQSLRTDISDKINIIDKDTVEIEGGESIFSRHLQSVLLYRQQHFIFEAQVRLTYEPESFKHLAGLLYRYDEENQHLLYVTFDEEANKKCLCIQRFESGNFSFEPLKIYFENGIDLKLLANYDVGQFYYSVDGENYLTAGKSFDTSHLSDENARPMGFTGAFAGLYSGDFDLRKKKARFSKFRYTAKHEV